MRRYTLLLITLFFAFGVYGQEGTLTKTEGDSAYIRSDYAAAIQIYEQLLQQGESSEIYYNLGNSYYKSDNIGKAILNYERALLLEPGNADIRANLDIARSKTIDKVIPASDIFFVSWIKSLINTQSIDTWATCGILFFFLLIVCACLFLFAKQTKWKKTGFFAGITFLLLVILVNIFAAYQKNSLVNHDKAIILSPSVVVRSTPSENGTSLFVLHEGHKVTIKDNSMREWKEIQLEDGKVGWILTSTLEVI